MPPLTTPPAWARGEGGPSGMGSSRTERRGARDVSQFPTRRSEKTVLQGSAPGGEVKVTSLLRVRHLWVRTPITMKALQTPRLRDVLLGPCPAGAVAAQAWPAQASLRGWCQTPARYIQPPGQWATPQTNDLHEGRWRNLGFGTCMPDTGE